MRARSAGEANGGEALPGTGDADDWQGFVPAALVPQVEDPRSGSLFSANHRPIGSFYPVGLGTSTGSMGDTIRSWRLRERLSGRERFSPADVREVHYDTVNPARREIVRLGLHLRATQPALHRPFRTPLYPLVPLVGALMCGVLLMSLMSHAETRDFFLVYLAGGVALYFAYGLSHSKLGKGEIVIGAEPTPDLPRKLDV